MDLKNLKLHFQNFTNGGPAILKAIDPDYPYRDGQRVTTEIVGRKVTVVFPENGYETMTVRVADPVDALSPLLAKATASEPVYVAFEDFEAGFRNQRDRNGVWQPTLYAKASAVRVAPNPAELDFGTDID